MIPSIKLMNFVKAWAAERENHKSLHVLSWIFYEHLMWIDLKALHQSPWVKLAMASKCDVRGSSWKAFQSQFQWLKLQSFDTKPMATIFLFSF